MKNFLLLCFLTFLCTCVRAHGVARGGEGPRVVTTRISVNPDAGAGAIPDWRDSNCPECLLEEMTRRIEMTSEQKQAVLAANAFYLQMRTHLLKNPPAIGSHTALLSCWDNWQQLLAAILSPKQMIEFYSWQKGTDLLNPDLYQGKGAGF